MAKKSYAFIILLSLTIILLSSSVLAQTKISVSTIKETFDAGEPITLKVSLFDTNNAPINTEVNIVLEDAEKRVKIEKTIQSNKFVDISLGEGATHGYWEITANYQGQEAKTIFIVEIKELAKFELNKDILKITNIGNTKYTKTVQIIIGGTIGIKEPKLNIGQSVGYRLIAPDGTYNIRITDGKTTLEKGNIQLTGKTIGILNENIGKGSVLTGGIKPEDETTDVSVFQNKFVYAFILVIFGAMILLAIERRYRKRAE